MVCLLGLTACGSKEKVDDELAEALSQSSIGIIENVYNGLDEATSQDLQSEGAEGVEYVFESYFGMKVDGNGMISAFDSYLMATKEIGNLVSINNYTAEYDTSGEKIIVTVNCTFDNKTADVEFIYKKDLYHTLTSSATNIMVSRWSACCCRCFSACMGWHGAWCCVWTRRKGVCPGHWRCC